ncbi:hypothetical protein ACFVWN_01275 [Nocardiopsis flavescens]|uniref:hypothetical protein n=1 Tax=Nocardiopsis flavescens TaxID=758803 RepID=UPI003650DB48
MNELKKLGGAAAEFHSRDTLGSMLVKNGALQAIEGLTKSGVLDVYNSSLVETMQAALRDTQDWRKPVFSNIEPTIVGALYAEEWDEDNEEEREAITARASTEFDVQDLPPAEVEESIGQAVAEYQSESAEVQRVALGAAEAVRENAQVNKRLNETLESFVALMQRQEQALAERTQKAEEGEQEAKQIARWTLGITALALIVAIVIPVLQYFGVLS